MAKRDKIRRFARAAASGGKTTASAALAGGGAYLVHYQAAQMVPGIFGHWLWGPLSLATVGHLLTKRPKLRTAGVAIAGAAGYALGLQIQARRMQQAAALQVGGLQDDDVSGLQDDDVRAGVAAFA